MRANWKTEALGDVCEVVGGGTPSKAVPSYYGGDIPWATVRDMKADPIEDTECRITTKAVRSSATNVIPRGNVVIATRVGLGKVCMLAQDTAINQDLRGIIPRNGRLNVRFLYLWLRSVSPRIIEEGTGATVQGVKLPFIKSLKVPVPSISEQERIVSTIDKSFEGIALAKARAAINISNARDLFESQLQALFSGSHTHVALTDLAIAITDGDHSPPPKSSSGIPFVTISNITKDTRTINFADTFTVAREYFDQIKPTRKPRQGDVLYTVTGATLGIPIHVDHAAEFCFQRHIGLIRPKPTVDSLWLSYAMLSPQVFRQATAGATGAAQKTVSLTVLRSIKIPEHSLPEQRRIARRLASLEDATRSLVAVYSAKIAALDGLKQSLLHQAFSGNL